MHQCMYNCYQDIDKKANLHPSVPLQGIEGPVTNKICDINGFCRFTRMGDSNDGDVVDDGLQLSTLLEEETRDVVTDLFNQAEG